MISDLQHIIKYETYSRSWAIGQESKLLLLRKHLHLASIKLHVLLTLPTQIRCQLLIKECILTSIHSTDFVA